MLSEKIKGVIYEFYRDKKIGIKGVLSGLLY